MPQFDPATFTPQLFWLLVSFVALYWVVVKIAIPRIGDVLEQRARVIQDDLDRAQSLKTETDAAVATYEKAMAEARAQAQAHIRAVNDDLKATAERRTADVSAQVGQQIVEAEARIAKARASALESIRGVAAEAARDAVAKLAGITPDAGQVDAAVAAVLKGRG